jgi:hypothetical protein
MKVDIYKNMQDENRFLSVPSGTSVKESMLVDCIGENFLNSLTIFEKYVNLDLEKPRNALDIKDILRQINKNGYAIHGAKIEIR